MIGIMFDFGIDVIVNDYIHQSLILVPIIDYCLVNLILVNMVLIDDMKFRDAWIMAMIYPVFKDRIGTSSRKAQLTKRF